MYQQESIDKAQATAECKEKAFVYLSESQIKHILSLAKTPRGII
jgi:hypothetical protein